LRYETVARHYAEVLFDIGERHAQHESLAAAFEEWVRALAEEPRLRIFLETPKVGVPEKQALLRRLLEGRAPPLFLNFLLVVLQKRRQRLYTLIASHYRALVEAKLGHLHVQVTTAQEPDERFERQIGDLLSDKLGQRVIPHVRVDPAILGGIIVRYGDRVMDGSVRRRLVALRRRMLDTELAKPA
jgi:F-type H+-transporting ATPase subunit delta